MYSTVILAPAGVCLDVARDLDFHRWRLAATRDRAVSGRTSRLIGPDEKGTGMAPRLGRRGRFSVRRVAFDLPRGRAVVGLPNPSSRTRYTGSDCQIGRV